MQNLDQMDQANQEYMNLLMYLIRNTRFKPLENKLATLDSLQVEKLLLGEDVPQLKEKFGPIALGLYENLLSRLKDLSCVTLYCIDNSEKHYIVLLLLNSSLLISNLGQKKSPKPSELPKLLNKLGIKDEDLEDVQLWITDGISLQRQRRLEYQGHSGHSDGSSSQQREESSHSSTFTPSIGPFDQNLISSIDGFISFPVAHAAQQNQQEIRFLEEACLGFLKEKCEADINGYSNTFDQSVISSTNREFYHPNGPSYTGDVPVSQDPRYQLGGIVRLLYKKKN